jgi:hypothetical protein
MVRGDTVLGPVIDRLGLATDVAELRDRVHVDVDPNGIPIITFTVYARTKAEATATAHAIAERMMALSRGALSGVQLPVAAPPSPSDASGLQVSITRVERKLARLHGLANSAPPAHRRPIERRIARMNDLLILLQEDYRRTVRVAEGSPNQLQVVTPAEAKPGRIRPLLLTDALLGATIGALAGCMLFVGVAMRRRAGSQPSAPAPPLVRDAWAREVSVAQEA